ncbi:MAG TPA: SDR family NAD(P)-dependent oxidoreductase, partial [Orrella sp.]
MAELLRFGDLQDKVVWITGAAKGMGLAMAHAFAQQGARLALMDIDEQGLQQARESLALSSDRCLVLTASVTQPEQMDKAVEQVVSFFGCLDVLINNAGVSMNQPSLEVSAQDWVNTININLNGVFFCAQAAGRQMIEQGSGVIVCMGSIYSVITAPDRAAYCASKAAVVAVS